ncbi:probable protein phosphatase 2C 33 isoform X1 [Miscanthus floridulus]|uniref:probable protein phosphatase 2C 33 isoform X1 n=1 Tax=Miscanthus floridulus TaxID=154761 RepID=UPI003458E889
MALAASEGNLSPALPLATLIGRELRGDGTERPHVRYGHSGFAKRGEDYFLVKPDCLRVPGDPSSSFSVFAVFDGHNGVSAAVFSKEKLLEHVMSAVPQGISREDWLQALPRALVAGFVKTDIDFQRKGEMTPTHRHRVILGILAMPLGIWANLAEKMLTLGTGAGETSGTTATLVVVDGFMVTVASVGDSRCILDTQGGEVSLLTVDHRLEENAEERERVTASGGEVSRLNLCGGQEVGPLRCWPGGLCLSRSIGDTDVGEFIVPIPHVKQVKLPNTGGRLIIASDGIWDALSSEIAAQACRGLPAELAAKLVVKQALKTSGLKDDTTCVVVDIIPSDHCSTPPALSPKKNQNKLRSLIFGRRSHSSVGKLSKSASLGSVEEIFEEGSAMLEERLGRNFPSKANLPPFRCAICQMDQEPFEGLMTDNVGGCCSAPSTPWAGPYLCSDCRKKKDAMEGKRSNRRQRAGESTDRNHWALSMQTCKVVSNFGVLLLVKKRRINLLLFDGSIVR